MENNTKQSSKLRSKILKMLPKAAAAVNLRFQNPPFSPGRDHHHKGRSENGAPASRLKPHGNKGFSGPIMIPVEARRKPKDGGIETQEPTSPKISCIGQIKHKKKQIKKQNAKAMSLPIHNTTIPTAPKDTTEVKKKQASKRFQRMFFHTGKPKTGTRKSSAASSTTLVGGEGNNNNDAVSDNAPPIGYMRRFASGRETFANFDWKAQIAPEEMNHRDCYSEDDRVDSDAEEEEEEEEDEVIIPFSAPLAGRGGGGGGGGGSVANLQPRKEINLWKRRTMAPPRPLQLNPVLTAK